MTQSKKIALEEAVTADRLYIGKHRDELGIEIMSFRHPEETSSVDEKIEMMKRSYPPIKLERRDGIKMLFGTIDWEIYGIVLPELGYRISKPMVEKMFEQAGIELYDPKFGVHQDYIPKPFQAMGVCTPFVTEQELEGLAGVFVHKSLVDYEQYVDVSTGKVHQDDQEAHYRSMLIPGRAIPEILRREYKDTGKIHLVDMEG